MTFDVEPCRICGLLECPGAPRFKGLCCNRPGTTPPGPATAGATDQSPASGTERPPGRLSSRMKTWGEWAELTVGQRAEVNDLMSEVAAMEASLDKLWGTVKLALELSIHTLQREEETRRLSGL